MKNGKRPTKAQKKILAFYGGLADLQEYQHGAGHSPPVHRTYQTYPEASGHGNHMTL